MTENRFSHKLARCRAQGRFLMARRRSRFLQNRRERGASRDGPDPGAVMRLSVFIALVLVAVAVAAGFQGARFASAMAGWIAALGPLAEPVVLGASWIELGAGAMITAVIAALVIRSLRR